MSRNRKINSAGQDSSRRTFLQKAGVAAGGLSLLGLPGHSVWGQQGQCKPVPPSVVPTNCDAPPPKNGSKNFSPDTGLAVRTRKSAFELNKTDIDKLQAAYCALRQLSVTDPTDPRGWMQQANVHCHYCSGAQANQLPEIHNSWLFFPWHRCYLYFHERILGSLIGDMTLTLPYWDWDTPGRSILPTPYVTPNNSSNQLWDKLRDETTTAQIPSQYVSQNVMYNKQTGVMYQPTPQLFMGTFNPDPEGQAAHGGAVEFGPHGAIHVWTADHNVDFNNPKPDMGILQTAAQDPVFFSHHGNIDRLWTVWLNNDLSHQNFNSKNSKISDTWLNSSWTFYDENKQLVTIKVSDVLDTANSLRYTYSTPQPPTLAKARSVRSPITLAAASAAGFQQTQTGKAQAEGEGNVKLTPNPLTRKIRIPADLRKKIRANRADALDGYLYILRIEGIVVPANKSALINVFANIPNATAATNPEGPNYLGYFTIVAKAVAPGAHDGHNSQSVALNVTHQVARLIQSGKDLTVTLVPVTGKGKKPTAFEMSIGKIYLSEETR